MSSGHLPLASRRAELTPDTRYRVVVEVPGGVVTEVRVQWIHIRDTFKQFSIGSVFQNVFIDGHPHVAADLSDPKVARFRLGGTDSAVAVCFDAQSSERLEASGLETAHSYLWPRITVSMVTGGRARADVRYDAKDRGLLW